MKPKAAAAAGPHYCSSAAAWVLGSDPVPSPWEQTKGAHTTSPTWREETLQLQTARLPPFVYTQDTVTC